MREHGTPESPISLDEYNLDINHLITVIDLLNGGHNIGNLTKDKVKELDLFVKKFDLDKDQWKYT